MRVDCRYCALMKTSSCCGVRVDCLHAWLLRHCVQIKTWKHTRQSFREFISLIVFHTCFRCRFPCLDNDSVFKYSNGTCTAPLGSSVRSVTGNSLQWYFLLFVVHEDLSQNFQWLHQLPCIIDVIINSSNNIYVLRLYATKPCRTLHIFIMG